MPGKDFTRRRALGFENIILLLLTMGSESVGKNLMEVFHFQEKAPFAPAFPQYQLSYIPGTDRQHGWNRHHINALFDLENGIYTDVLVQKEREKNENKALCEMADRSHVLGTVIVLADRNYDSLNNPAHLENRG